MEGPADIDHLQPSDSKYFARSRGRGVATHGTNRQMADRLDQGSLMHQASSNNPRRSGRVPAGCIALAMIGAQMAAQKGVQEGARAAAPNRYAIVSPPPALAKHAMVVSIHHDASDAGVAILKQGGNAVDAAVAVGFALAVVFPQAGNLGGGGFMLIRMKSGDAHFVDYRERAPAAASAGMYLDARGNVVPGLSTVGYKAIGVPGTVAGLVYAEKTYGRLTLKQVMAPAIRLAREGYALSDEEARSIASAKNLAQFADSRRNFQRNGSYFKPGERFTQPELARTLDRIATDPATFYTGSMAAELAAFVQKGGGLITSADLAAYEVKDRAPLVGTYRGYQIVTAPPPSSGGAVLLESLNILSGYDLAKMGDRTPQQVHILVEAYRRAYMDRADYLGDPDFVAMPIAQMLSPAYAAAWRGTIQPVAPSPSATLTRPTGFLPPPPRVNGAQESTQTTHFSVVDAEGNAVSNTYTLNGLFGSGVTAGRLGFLLNNEMDDFTSKPGVPNMYGLIQSTANAIGPGKRPLSSMAPTILTKDDQVAMVIGTPGGSRIFTSIYQVITDVYDFSMPLPDAVAAMRFHHQLLPPNTIFWEPYKPIDGDLAKELEAKGYTLAGQDFSGDIQAIKIDGTTPQAVADPRGRGVTRIIP